METTPKQQVVFVSRKLWAGGAEKVLYYLAHHLDRKLFEPIIVYMIWQDGIPVTYDNSIPVHCLAKDKDTLIETKTPENNFKEHAGNSKPSLQIRLLRFFYRLFQRFSEILRRNNLVQRIRTLTHDENNALTPNVVYIEEYRVAERIAISIGINIPDVLRLDTILKTLRDDAILIPMQEEPTVRVWLGQMYSSHKYISYLCAPESLHIPLIYPDKERFLVENWVFANAERNADAIVVPNSWMSNDMIRNFGATVDQVNILPNPVDCEIVLSKMSQPLSKEFSLPKAKTIFVQLARIDPQKNHLMLVAACQILRLKYDDFFVLVIGNGSEYQKIKEVIDQKGLSNHILMLGELANPYPYLAIARASLLTSEFEASPLVLVDSMLCGAVPIATDCVCGPSDMLGENEFGFLVPPGDAHAFADAMYRIAVDDELHQRLRENGQREALRYDIKRVVKEWEDLIIKVAKKTNTEEGER